MDVAIHINVDAQSLRKRKLSNIVLDADTYIMYAAKCVGFCSLDSVQHNIIYLSRINQEVDRSTG